MKKVLALLIVLVLLTGIFTGCSKDSLPKDVEQAEVIELDFWHVFSEDFGAPVINEMVAAFNAENEGKIVVKAIYNANMYPGLMQNLQADVASGDSPSIVMMGYNYLKYFEANFNYVSPQKIIDAYFPEDATYLEDTFLPNILSLAQVDEKQVGLAYSISTPLIYYNADLFEAAGLDPAKPPATWKEVQEYAKQISENTGEYGFYMQEYSDNWAIQGLLESNGARILENNQAVFASAESEEAYTILADMVLRDKSALHITADEGIQAFSNGKVGIFCGSSAKIGTIQGASTFDLRGGAFPVFEGKDLRIPAGGNFLPIMATTEAEQRASWEFIKFIMQPEWLSKWSISTGYLPPRHDVASDPEGLQSYIEENELMGISLKQMDGIYSWVAFPGDSGVQVEQIFADTRDKILGGDEDVSTALTYAQNQVNKLLEEYK